MFRYVDDVPPRRDERVPYSSDDESDSDPGTSESATQYYAGEALTHDGDQSSSNATESTAEINLDTDFYKQECERLVGLIGGQNEVAATNKFELDELTASVCVQKTAIDRFESSSRLNAALLESHQSQNVQYSREACT